MYLSGIFALDLHFKYKILSPFLKKKKKKKDNRNEKLNIAENFIDDIWIITHRTPDKNFLESSESLEISTRRSSISKIYNYPKKKKKYNFSWKKKRDISRRYQQGDSSKRGRELRSQFVKKFVPKEEEKGEGEGKRKYVSRLESMAAKGKRDVT